MSPTIHFIFSLLSFLLSPSQGSPLTDVLASFLSLSRSCLSCSCVAVVPKAASKRAVEERAAGQY